MKSKNYKYTQRKKSSSCLNLASTTKCYRECACEDLPNNIKASTIILKLPFDPPVTKIKLRTPSNIHLPKQPKQQNQLITLSQVDNCEYYKPPIFDYKYAKHLNSLDLLPHRYAVEFNSLQRVRSRIKNRPKLRRLVIILK